MQQATATVDIAISGGSFAGLAIAVALSQALHGALRISVIAPTFPAPANDAPIDPRSVALSAASKNLLSALGVWNDIASVCQPVSEIAISDSDLNDAVRPTRLRYDTVLPSGEPSMWIVPNASLGAVLLAHANKAPGVSLIANRRVTGLTDHGEAIALTLDDGTDISTRLAIAADGRRSTLRDASGITTIGWDYDQHGIVATVTASQPHHGRAVQNFLPNGPFAILPLTGNRLCITWSEQTGEAKRILAGTPAEILAEIERRFAPNYGHLTLENKPQSWSLNVHLARSFIAHRVALAGDAAHGVHPIAGQGLNLGFRDVAALVEVIAETARLGLDIGHGTTLDRYQRWRRFDSLTSTAAFDTLNRLFSQNSNVARSVRGAGLSIIDRAPHLKALIVQEAAGLSGDVPKLLLGQMP
ncbi:MAG: ubiquinone biosynthesis protein UbiH [Hyphomicrobiaceae bacterium]|nr:ubiquinone biosynthesis protein UbiH [Hyphomicrobiaceae bacterium]